jgi:hypothetical protein
MGRMKDFIMQVSEDMGFHGEINDEVLEAAQTRLYDLVIEKDKQVVAKEFEDKVVEPEVEELTDETLETENE